MISYNKIAVFDFETDGSNPKVCSPVQLACVMIDTIKNEILEGSEFNIQMKPDKLEQDSSYSYKNEADGNILEWHSKVRACSEADVLEGWKNAAPQKQAWQMFIQYLDKYHCRASKKTKFSSPIAAGYNIQRFDLKIIERLSVKYDNASKEGESEIFHPRDNLDVMFMLYPWFRNLDDVKSLSLDNVRQYLGIPTEGGHDALKDVRDTAEILIRLLKLHKSLSQKILFKDSCKK